MFDLKLYHIPGTRMIQSDTLSQLAYLNQEVSDNDALTLLPQKLFVQSIDLTLCNKITVASPFNPIVRGALAALQSNAPLPMKSTKADWKEDNGIVTFKDRVYVPADPALQREILSYYHNSCTTRHSGHYGTVELVRRDYWWPGLATATQQYVEDCALCQQNKINTHPTAVPLQPIPATSKLPFKAVTMDFIMDLPPSQGYTACWIVVDHNATKEVVILLDE